MRKILILILLVCCQAFAGTLPDRFIILGGELSNSAATSVKDIDEVMPRMKAMGLNTVLIPVYWELTEPTEGSFDFTLVDHVISSARNQGLKVVILWFGAWKNSMSCYTPAWFKQDTKRFPRAMTKEGKPLEIASCFSNEVLQADLKAFKALMNRIKKCDPKREVVIMMQIENEIGMLESARDHSPLAEKAYCEDRWASLYGTDEYADEKFMAQSYARYVEHLAHAARSIHDIPLYVNAAMNSRGRKPGEYPSAGPLAHLANIWKKEAPSIDLLAPDIYDAGFKTWASRYAMPERPQDGGAITNRLFIPESRCCQNSGARALYSFGEHRALGFSPFAIDQASAEDTESVTKAYGLLTQLTNSKPSPFALNNTPNTWGLLFDQNDSKRLIEDHGIVITCRHYFTLPWDSRAKDGSTWPEGGAMLVKLGKYEYLLAGNGIVIDFKTKTEAQQIEQQVLGEDGFTETGKTADQVNSDRLSFQGKRIGLLSVDEVSIDDKGGLQFLRRQNGDQTHQGRHARIGVGEWKILHIKLYEY